MIFDGAHVLLTGTYFGPKYPGPWSAVVAAVGVNPMKLGEVFVLLGALWLTASAAIWLRQRWGRRLMLVAAVATLWYVPVGSLLALICITVLLRFKDQLT
jgi:hypothetical protein